MYDQLLPTKAAVQIGAFALDKPLLLWINDGLMAIFFLLVGLEVSGIGFTMSLFIASLAFERGAVDYIVADRLGILIGSLLSATFGYGLLNYALKHKKTAEI